MFDVMKKIPLIFLLSFLLLGCGPEKIEIQDVSINFLDKLPDARGKYWEICWDYEDADFYGSNPVAYFDIKLKDDSVSRQFEIWFVHFEPGCNKKQLSSSFLRRHSSKSDEVFIRDLDFNDIEYVTVTVKQKKTVVFNKIIYFK
jgi:hypothetical protein